MNIKTLWNERFGMLMASGSPGSALAYHAGSRVSATAVVRRKNAAADSLKSTSVRSRIQLDEIAQPVSNRLAGLRASDRTDSD